jgi:hypothetical protein
MQFGLLQATERSAFAPENFERSKNLRDGTATPWLDTFAFNHETCEQGNSDEKG